MIYFLESFSPLQFKKNPTHYRAYVCLFFLSLVSKQLNQNAKNGTISYHSEVSLVLFSDMELNYNTVQIILADSPHFPINLTTIALKLHLHTFSDLIWSYLHVFGVWSYLGYPLPTYTATRAFARVSIGLISMSVLSNLA